MTTNLSAADTTADRRARQNEVADPGNARTHRSAGRKDRSRK